MNTKICSICKKEKDLTNFHQSTVTKDRLDRRCKECCSIYKKNYYIEKKKPKIPIEPGFKICYTCNIIKPIKDFCKHKSRKDGFAHLCKGCRRIKQKERDIKHPNKLQNRKEKALDYYKRNRDKILLQAQNRSRTLEFKISKRLYYEKYLSVLQHKIAHNLRGRIRLALKGLSKTESTKKILGCSIDFFISYLESKFLPGMTRENYGLWQIDHIKPCNAFDLSDPKQLAECCHYTNLQPLWAKDNIIKSDKY